MATYFFRIESICPTRSDLQALTSFGDMAEGAQYQQVNVPPASREAAS